jgi:hypothetical protein
MHLTWSVTLQPDPTIILKHSRRFDPKTRNNVPANNVYKINILILDIKKKKNKTINIFNLSFFSVLKT